MSRLLSLLAAAVVLFGLVPAAAAQDLRSPLPPDAEATEAATEEPTEEPTGTPEEPVDPPVVTVPVACDNADGLEVVTPTGLQSGIPTPTFEGSGSEYKQFLVDLSATSTDATAPLAITMTWDLPVNDYDLAAYSERSSGLSENYQPFDPVEESVTIVAGHCEVIEVEAINFLAPVDLDTLTLDFVVGPVTEPAAS